MNSPTHRNLLRLPNGRLGRLVALLSVLVPVMFAAPALAPQALNSVVPQIGSVLSPQNAEADSTYWITDCNTQASIQPTDNPIMPFTTDGSAGFQAFCTFGGGGDNGLILNVDAAAGGDSGTPNYDDAGDRADLIWNLGSSPLNFIAAADGYQTFGGNGGWEDGWVDDQSNGGATGDGNLEPGAGGSPDGDPDCWSYTGTCSHTYGSGALHSISPSKTLGVAIVCNAKAAEGGNNGKCDTGGGVGAVADHMEGEIDDPDNQPSSTGISGIPSVVTNGGASGGGDDGNMTANFGATDDAGICTLTASLNGPGGSWNTTAVNDASGNLWDQTMPCGASTTQTGSWPGLGLASSTSGTYTLTVNAANPSQGEVSQNPQIDSYSFYVDDTTPVVNLSPASSAWQNSAIPINVSVDDSGTGGGPGIASIGCSDLWGNSASFGGGSGTISSYNVPAGGGADTWSCSATDIDGNTSSAGTTTVYIDPVQPTLVLSRHTLGAVDSWTNQAGDVDINATAGISGLAAGNPDCTIAENGGGAVDVSSGGDGNWSASGTGSGWDINFAGSGEYQIACQSNSVSFSDSGAAPQTISDTVYLDVSHPVIATPATSSTFEDAFYYNDERPLNTGVSETLPDGTDAMANNSLSPDEQTMSCYDSLSGKTWNVGTQDPNGAFPTTLLSSNGNGINLITCTAQDFVGNTSTVSYSIAYDNITPTLHIVSAPSGDGSDSLTINGQTTTDPHNTLPSAAVTWSNKVGDLVVDATTGPSGISGGQPICQVQDNGPAHPGKTAAVSATGTPTTWPATDTPWTAATTNNGNGGWDISFTDQPDTAADYIVSCYANSVAEQNASQGGNTDTGNFNDTSTPNSDGGQWTDSASQGSGDWGVLQTTVKVDLTQPDTLSSAILDPTSADADAPLGGLDVWQDEQGSSNEATDESGVTSKYLSTDPGNLPNWSGVPLTITYDANSGEAGLAAGDPIVSTTCTPGGLDTNAAQTGSNTTGDPTNNANANVSVLVNNDSLPNRPNALTCHEVNSAGTQSTNIVYYSQLDQQQPYVTFSQPSGDLGGQDTATTPAPAVQPAVANAAPASSPEPQTTAATQAGSSTALPALAATPKATKSDPVPATGHLAAQASTDVDGTTGWSDGPTQVTALPNEKTWESGTNGLYCSDLNNTTATSANYLTAGATNVYNGDDSTPGSSTLPVPATGVAATGIHTISCYGSLIAQQDAGTPQSGSPNMVNNDNQDAPQTYTVDVDSATPGVVEFQNTTTPTPDTEASWYGDDPGHWFQGSATINLSAIDLEQAQQDATGTNGSNGDDITAVVCAVNDPSFAAGADASTDPLAVTYPVSAANNYAVSITVPADPNDSTGYYTLSCYPETGAVLSSTPGADPNAAANHLDGTVATTQFNMEQGGGGACTTLCPTQDPTLVSPSGYSNMPDPNTWYTTDQVAEVQATLPADDSPIVSITCNAPPSVTGSVPGEDDSESGQITYPVSASEGQFPNGTMVTDQYGTHLATGIWSTSSQNETVILMLGPGASSPAYKLGCWATDTTGHTYSLGEATVQIAAPSGPAPACTTFCTTTDPDFLQETYQNGPDPTQTYSTNQPVTLVADLDTDQPPVESITCNTPPAVVGSVTTEVDNGNGTITYPNPTQSTSETVNIMVGQANGPLMCYATLASGATKSMGAMTFNWQNASTGTTSTSTTSTTDTTGTNTTPTNTDTNPSGTDTTPSGTDTTGGTTGSTTPPAAGSCDTFCKTPSPILTTDPYPSGPSPTKWYDGNQSDTVIASVPASSPPITSITCNAPPAVKGSVVGEVDGDGSITYPNSDATSHTEKVNLKVGPGAADLQCYATLADGTTVSLGQQPINIDESNPTGFWKPQNPTDRAVVTFEASDNGGSGVASVKLALRSSGGKSYPLTLTSTTTSDGAYTATIPSDGSIPNGTYTEVAQVSDLAGNNAKPIDTLQNGKPATVTLPVGDPTEIVDAIGAGTKAPPLPGVLGTTTKNGTCTTVAKTKPSKGKKPKVKTKKVKCAKTKAVSTKGGTHGKKTAKRLAEVKTKTKTKKTKKTKAQKVTAKGVAASVAKPLKLAYGGKSTADGILTNKATDQPIGGAQVTISEIVTGSSTPKKLGVAKTNKKGIFTYHVPAGPSRHLTYTYAGSGTTAPSSGNLAAEVVTGKITLTAPKKLKAGATTKLTGKVAGGFIPKGGVALRVYYTEKKRRGKGNFNTTYHTNKKGAFTIKLPGHKAVELHHTFNYYVAPVGQATWPFTPKDSRTVTISYH